MTAGQSSTADTIAMTQLNSRLPSAVTDLFASIAIIL
jgi:hypothetical protein